MTRGRGRTPRGQARGCPGLREPPCEAPCFRPPFLGGEAERERGKQGGERVGPSSARPRRRAGLVGGPRPGPGPVPTRLTVRAHHSRRSVAAGRLVSAVPFCRKRSRVVVLVMIGPQGLCSLGMASGGCRRTEATPPGAALGG